MKLMKAIVIREFGGPEVLGMEEVPRPTPQARQILIKVEASGVNPLETYLRSGTKIGSHSPALPYTPGSEASGIVVEVGPEASAFSVGDCIYGAVIGGAHAQFALMRTTAAQSLPEHLSFAQGSAVTIPYTAAHLALLHLGEVKAGEHVLIHGATGSVGLAAMQMAKSLGVTVYASAGTDEAHHELRLHGAQHTLNHRKNGDLAEVIQKNGGRRIDLILEMNATANLSLDLTVLSNGGRIVAIGGQGRVSIDPVEIIAKGSKVLGLSIPDTSQAVLSKTRSEIHEGLASRRLNPPHPTEMPLEQLAVVHEQMAKHGSRRFAMVPPDTANPMAVHQQGETQCLSSKSHWSKMR